MDDDSTDRDEQRTLSFCFRREAPHVLLRLNSKHEKLSFGSRESFSDRQIDAEPEEHMAISSVQRQGQSELR